jgi:hypothetical protein
MQVRRSKVWLTPAGRSCWEAESVERQLADLHLGPSEGHFVDSSTTPPAIVLSYAQQLTDQLVRATDPFLGAVYLHGSAALGGWVQAQSDIDVLVVAADSIPGAAVNAIAETLFASTSKCPGRKLESSVVTLAQAGEPAPPWPYLLHVSAGRIKAHNEVQSSSGINGDVHLVMQYAECRASGWPLYGPGPREVIGPVPRNAILDYLARELAWSLQHGSEASAVLSSCRAIIYLTDDKIVSKIVGGEAMLSSGAGPAEVIRRALDQQQGAGQYQRPAADAADFIRATIAALPPVASSGAGERTPE